jgi:predicted GIY-YIG superfamily endonuclease
MPYYYIGVAQRLERRRKNHHDFFVELRGFESHWEAWVSVLRMRQY